MPVGGKKYTVYTFNKETEEFEAYPLDDITDIIHCTESDAEKEENAKLTKLWWKGVKEVETAKKAKASASVGSTQTSRLSGYYQAL